MFDRLKMKLAARRVERKRDFAAADKRIMKNDSRTKRVLLWPFRMIGRGLRWVWDVVVSVISWIWELICNINLIGLLNLTLIIAIIVLFFMLIIDLVNVSRKPVVVMVPTKDATVQVIGKNATKQQTKKYMKNLNAIVLPLKRDEKTGNLEYGRAVNINGNESVQNNTNSENLYGDVIIETRTERNMLANGTKVNGNVYLQNMRKYVLPCDVDIRGNLFLRNVGMLQFCGKFTVNGNIYVSPRSSFGPLPASAELGGQIIM